MLVAMLVLSSVIGRPPQVQSALETLTTCQDLRAEACLFAAAWLKMGGDEAMPEVLKAAPGMTQSGQLLTVSAVGTVPSKAATDCLGKLAQDTSLDPMARALALEQLSGRPSPPKAKTGPIDIALSLVHDDDPTVRQAAVRMVANKLMPGDAKLMKVIVQATTDLDGGVRSETMNAFAACGCSESSTMLAVGLRDKDTRVRRSAVEGLAIVKSPGTIDFLVGMLNPHDESMNRIIARALRFQSGKEFGDDAAQWKRWLADQR